MDGLPAELLSAEILPHCLEYTPALRAVCRAWQRAVRDFPPRKTNGLGLKFLARSGNHSLISWTKDQRGHFMTPQLDAMLRAACRGGHTALARTLLAWGATVDRRTFCKACKSNQAPLVFELKALIPSDTHWGEDTLWGYLLQGARSAARHGNYELVATLATWGAEVAVNWDIQRTTFWGNVLEGASYGGHRDIIRMAHSCNRLAYGNALCQAAASGQIALMRGHFLQLGTGHDVFGYNALVHAVDGGHRECAAKLLEWGVVPMVGEVVRLAAQSGDPKLLDLIVARLGGRANPYPDILVGAAAGGHEDLLCRTREHVKMTNNRVDVWEVEELLASAAAAGHVHILRRLHTWSLEEGGVLVDPEYLARAFHAAIIAGQVGAAALLREQGAVCLDNDDFADAMSELASMGNITMMRFLHEWSGVDETLTEYTTALGAAAEKGEERVMELLYEWGEEDIRLEDLLHTLRQAAFARQTPAMQLLKQWIDEYTAAAAPTEGEEWFEATRTLIAGNLTTLLAKMDTRPRIPVLLRSVKTAEQFLQEWLDELTTLSNSALRQKPDSSSSGFGDLLAELFGETGESGVPDGLLAELLGEPGVTDSH